MLFEFDPNKSAANKDKHGIDFDEAQALWDDDRRIENDTSFHGEVRFMATGRIGERMWTAIFTMREERVRLISVRRARNEEIQRYQDDNS
jgi:uncharacterized DUF497 family protein